MGSVGARLETEFAALRLDMAKATKRRQRAQHAKEELSAPRAQQQAESKADVMAHRSLRPTVQAALTLLDYNKGFGELSVNTLVNDLVEQCELANKGDLSRAEALLIAQAHTLDAIFHELARRAQRVEYLNQFDVNLRLALKAQSQCRATLETLATIKNPQAIAFVRQANIANGPQQVNNGTMPSDTPVHARQTGYQQNKPLEAQSGEGLDPGTPGTASRADSPLETLELVHRAKNT